MITTKGENELLKDIELNFSNINSEEVQEVITAVPAWIVRWGTLLVFLILISIVGFSALIQYPDVVKTGLKINSLNAPKSVYTKGTGKIISLLVEEGMEVKQGTSLAFMESTAKHRDVLKLYGALIRINDTLNKTGIASKIDLVNLNLGELQGSYQNFYQQYLQLISTQKGGYYLRRKAYLERDLKEIQKLKIQIALQQELQKKEFKNITQEFEAYKKLHEKGVISNIEYAQQENKYYSGNYPLQQTTTSLLNNNSTYLGKQKEILELEHIVQDEKAKFTQSLNNMITEINSWLNQYVLSAPVSGTVSYAGIVQENQTVNANQELFMVNPANSDFFGEVQIPQYSMGKVRVGQAALIKLRSYPFEQYGIIRGGVSYISEVALRDSVFIAKIKFDHFERKDPSFKIVLKNGMQGDAEIITEESSLLQRLIRNTIRALKINH
ncbi:HlyD family efflux transporter periplasmic adaptor subunit [Pedobacter panaciterrae]|uniref:HlyD family secretion protein n=1 Tax=Pedobacter panaciterrae TaxID=363849 RepID=UPI00155DB175|nr:HlyD family efflux transporter periplasmic adaptor subunit [Pedobacter panaciterrae]NQX56815.1 HlyD family efflux transporter periplasmic adaptor subunit [Pedobacter panaciterrae]